MRILARSIDVGVSQHGIVQRMLLTEAFKILFNGKLAAGIRADRNRRGRNRCPNPFGNFAVDCSTGAGEHDLANLARHARLHNVQRPHDVDRSILLGFSHTDHHAGLSCLVTDRVRLERLKGFGDSRRVLNVYLKELGAGRDVFDAAAAEIIDYGHLPSSGQRTLCDMTPNESCSASNQQSHFESLLT